LGDPQRHGGDADRRLVAASAQFLHLGQGKPQVPRADLGQLALTCSLSAA
jgi:hypothetical protein